MSSEDLTHLWLSCTVTPAPKFQVFPCFCFFHIIRVSAQWCHTSTTQTQRHQQTQRDSNLTQPHSGGSAAPLSTARPAGLSACFCFFETGSWHEAWVFWNVVLLWTSCLSLSGARFPVYLTLKESYKNPERRVAASSRKSSSAHLGLSDMGRSYIVILTLWGQSHLLSFVFFRDSLVLLLSWPGAHSDNSDSQSLSLWNVRTHLCRHA